MAEDDSSIKAWLANHPRMMGVLFVLMMAITQIGTAAAANHSTTVGP